MCDAAGCYADAAAPVDTVHDGAHIDPETGQPLFHPVINAKSTKLAARSPDRAAANGAAAYSGYMSSAAMGHHGSTDAVVGAITSDRLYQEAARRQDRAAVQQAVVQQMCHLKANASVMRYVPSALVIITSP